MISNVVLKPYSEKSFVVIDTDNAYEKELMSLGGTKNCRLNDRERGVKFEGWIFSNKWKKQVEDWINTGEAPADSKTYPVTGSTRDLESRVQRLELMVSYLCGELDLSMDAVEEQIRSTSKGALNSTATSKGAPPNQPKEGKTRTRML